MKNDLGSGTRGSLVILNGFVLVHLPLGLRSGGSLPFIKHHGFLESDDPVVGGVDVTGRAGGLPISGPGRRRSVGPPSPRFPILLLHEEKPLLPLPPAPLPGIPYNPPLLHYIN